MRMRSLFRGGPEVGQVGLSLSAPPTASLPLRQLAILAPESEDPAVSGEDDAAACIQRAIELGVNLIDTDWITANGHAQEVLGRALQYLERDKLFITSKAGPRLAFHGELVLDNSRANLINQSIDSLFRLKTERIDLYQVHWPDDTSPVQTARGLEDIVSAGHAIWLGVCNYGVPQLEALTGHIKLQTVQAPLSLLNRRALPDLLPWCEAKGVGFLASDPLLSGLLTGRFSGDEEFTEQDRDEFFTQPKFAKAVALANELADLGDPGQLAVGWVLAQPGVSCVLCPPLSPDEFEKLAKAEPPDAATLESLDKLARTHGFI
jgi:aryl-alcohol dehydrogenase-like predicted oxidoreductase